MSPIPASTWRYRLKRFLAPQVAELVDRTGDDSVLDGRRVELVVAFCDLRGFTG
ncbi:MAG: hypothetical protein HYX38_29935 [Rhodospirillales bacterium]|nr:hypothetical protein [Rhodospirillales bacterium]